MDQQNTNVTKNIDAEFEPPVEETSIKIQGVKPIKKSKSPDSNVYKTIYGINFYNIIEIVYKMYKKGDIMIALDIDAEGAKSYALLQSTLAVQTLIMSCPKQERAFYDICIYSSKHNIRSYPVKLFFDIEEKDEDGKRVLFTREECNYICTKLYHNVCNVLLKYYAINYDIKNFVVVDSGDVFDWDEH